MLTIEQLCKEMKARGYPATLEYPGFIRIDCREQSHSSQVVFCLGNVNETWQADVCDPETLEPFAESTIETGIRASSEDVQAIAERFDRLLQNIL